MADAHGDSRLEAFSDGVFAIALTLLIIDVRLPAGERVDSAQELWRALLRLAPTIGAFLLSFAIVLVTWVNHHGALRLVGRTCGAFVYANGLLLLTVVFIPFPTALLGAFVWTDHAAPAVVLYDTVLAAQAIAWLCLTGTAIGNRLAINERAMATMRDQYRNGWGALALYGLLAVAALWFPLAVAIVTTATWIFWLALSIRLKTA